MDEIATLPDWPSIIAAADRRQISQIVHFTTTSGAVGVLASKALKSRDRVGRDEYLEHVYRPNVALRKDPAWTDYVSLSIERINDWMYRASERWHAREDNPWVVLSFRPIILSHPGVVFTTTNNIYSSCKREEGLNGFTRMFAESYRHYNGVFHDRSNKLPSWPTHRQAEVLYPQQLSCDHLQGIYVQLEQSLEDIEGALGGLQMSIPVRLAPEVFE